jgi:hypothetical protein
VRKSVSLPRWILLAVLVLLGTALLIAPYTFLPAVYESLVASDLQRQLDLQSTPEVEVRGATLAFVPRRVTAVGVPVPEALSDELLAEANFVYPLDDLPYGLRITDAETEEGRLVLSGEARNLPTGG